MLAHLQKLIVLSILTAAGAVAAVLLADSHITWALVAAAVVLSSYAWLLGVQFAIAYWLQSADPAGRVQLAHLIRAWWHEARQLPRVFFWRQPFRSKSVPDGLQPGDLRTSGVVLVHGYLCNRGLWNPWMVEFRARRIPFVAVNLEPIFGSIDCYAARIERAVQAVGAVTSQPVVLVGHSMGGLAIRIWMSQFSARDRVARVVTIGTPHRGTWLARFGYSLNARQMRIGGAWLTQLAASEGVSVRALFTCFYADCDNIVFPRHCATLPGAQNIHVPTCAHVQMAFEPTVMNEVLRWLMPRTQTQGQDVQAIR